MAPSKPLNQVGSYSDFLFISLLVVLATFSFLWNLGSGSLAAWDEAIYAEVSKEIVRSGDWLTLHWEYQPWFEKPPLFLWITASFYFLFGVSEFWARVPSALSGIALLVVTYLIGRFAYGKRVGFLAAAILLTCYHFLSFSRFGTMDVMVTLFVYLAVYAYLRLNRDQKWWYVVWASCALALMVKGAGGAVAPAAIILSLIFDKQFNAALRSRHFWQGILLAVLLVAPWHVVMLVWYGRAFVDEYVGYHVIARSTQTLEGHASGYFYYVGRLVDGFFPWCLLVPFSLVSIFRRNLKDRSVSWILLLLTALVFGLYTVIPTRRPWYIVPLYPALAILIAAFISNLYQNYQSRLSYRRLVTVGCAILIVIGGAYSFVSLYLNHKGEESVAKLARLSQSTSPGDKDSLVLLTGVEPIYSQIPLFYSDRPVQQTFIAREPVSEDAKRYVNYENLAEVIQDSTKPIILRKEDIDHLSRDYEIHVLAEEDSLAFATIKHK